uniref:Uncharacterized protein n=1 Tax=Trichobilharzia regenti TaxID=157069 RepID=A0AA85ISK6_TRIRE|nr:unnamed protein product [Trichobilharzia regenti]
MISTFIRYYLILILCLTLLPIIKAVNAAGVIYDFRLLFLQLWEDLCARLAGTFNYFLQYLKVKYGGKQPGSM